MTVIFHLSKISIWQRYTSTMEKIGSEKFRYNRSNKISEKWKVWHLLVKFLHRREGAHIRSTLTITHASLSKPVRELRIGLKPVITGFEWMELVPEASGLMRSPDADPAAASLASGRSRGSEWRSGTINEEFWKMGRWGFRSLHRRIYFFERGYPLAAWVKSQMHKS